MSLDLLGSNIIAIISQRLVRKVCRLCCTIEDNLSSPKARGCIHCDYTGYKGRTIIAEILPMNHALEEAILEGKLSRLRLLQCCDPGHQTLKDHADILIKNGITTSDEVSRVINYPGDDYAPV
jgi:general secretion pathway protein E